MEQKFNWPVIGHQKVQDYLQKSLKNGKIYPAYLFIGPKSVGKRTLARYFISSLHCSNNQKGEQLPCNECGHCLQLKKNIHPDFYSLEKHEDKKNVSIEQVRELISKLNKKSFLSKYKIALIANVDKLGLEAANSLLKTLEEPSANTVIILTATSRENLLPTIVSRCQVVSFQPVKKDEIYNHVLSKKDDREIAKEFSNLSYGMPGKAINLLNNQESLAIQHKDNLNFLKAINSNKINQRIGFIDSFVSKCKNFENLLDNWSLILRDLMIVTLKQNNLVTNRSLLSELEKSANNFETTRVRGAIKMIENSKKDLSKNANPKLVLENLIINI